jgi:GNAT superfamily N-acetyltransferase
MLVKLYRLPPLAPPLNAVDIAGFTIRRALVDERHILYEWVLAHFDRVWAIGCEIAFERQPIPCYIAVERDRAAPGDPDDAPGELLVGFAIYDVAGRGIFGPIGVREEYQGRGIGRALLLRCLHTMADDGYSYAIIGEVGPDEFYSKTVGAMLIEDSERGTERRYLRG